MTNGGFTVTGCNSLIFCYFICYLWEMCEHMWLNMAITCPFWGWSCLYLVLFKVSQDKIVFRLWACVFLKWKTDVCMTTDTIVLRERKAHPGEKGRVFNLLCNDRSVQHQVLLKRYCSWFDIYKSISFVYIATFLLLQFSLYSTVMMIY